MESFTKRREGCLPKAVSQDRQQSAAEEGEVGQQVGLAGTRTVFPHQHVTAPVIADFNPAPMSPDQSQPLRGRMLLRGCTGEIIPGFGSGDPGSFLGAVTAHHDQGPGKGEVGGEGFDGEGVEFPEFDAPVTGVAVGKKGVLGTASKLCAAFSKWGWLPLIWKR